MDRRRVLRRIGAVSAGVASAFAGCSTSPRRGATESPTHRDRTESASTAGRPPTPSDPAEAFELVSIDSPSVVEINAPYRFGFTVRNTADSALTFTTGWSFRTPQADWRRRSWVTVDWPIAFSVPAGETKRWQSLTTDFNNVARYEFRLDRFGATWSVESVPARRQFGEPYRTLDRTVLTIEGLELEADPHAAADGAMSVDDRLARAAVRVRNLTRHPMPHDEPGDLVLVASEQVIEPTPRPGDARAVLAPPGSVTTGWVAFAVPPGTALADSVVSWRPAHFDGPVRVDWRAND